MINIYTSFYHKISNPNSIGYIKDDLQRTMIIENYINSLQIELDKKELDFNLKDNSKQWNIYQVFDIQLLGRDMSWYDGMGATLDYDLFLLECIDNPEIFHDFTRTWFVFAHGYCGKYYEYPTLMQWQGQYSWTANSISYKEIIKIMNEIGGRETDAFQKNLYDEKCRWQIEQDAFDDENFYS